MNVTLEDAYREACAALGEAMVRERLLTSRVSVLEAAASQPDVSSENTGSAAD